MLVPIKKALRRAADQPARHVLQNLLLCLPGTGRLQKAIMTTGAMNDPELMGAWAQKVLDAARDCRVEVVGADLVEVGPGHSLGVAVGLILAGAASVSAVDVYAFADLTDPEAFRPVVERFRQLGLARDPQTGAREVLPKLSYRIVSNDGSWPLPDESKTIVYSYFSGEHLRDPEAILRETHRVLEPGGLCLHAIDLRDHYHFEGNWLQFLYFEPWLWEAMTGRRGRWCNRLRAPAWHDLFARWFEVVRFEWEKKPIPQDFRPSKLASPFRRYDLETLSISHLWVVARKTSSLDEKDHER